MPLLSRRRFLKLGLLGLGGAFGVGAYTHWVEPHWLEIVRRPLAIHNLPQAWEGRQVAFLADLHVGPRVADDYVLSVFARVRALAPDLVLFGGDLTDNERGIFEHVERIYARLPQGRRGTFGVFGNHDYGLNWAQPETADRLAALLQPAGLRMLRNETVEIDGLQIAGLDDLWAKRFRPDLAFAALDPARAMLALSHNPDTVDRTGWEKFRGPILAGHTHGGQCRAPFLPPPMLPVRNRRYVAGPYDLDGDRQLYISRGVGHLTQVRFNVRPEVTVFRLTRA